MSRLAVSALLALVLPLGCVRYVPWLPTLAPLPEVSVGPSAAPPSVPPVPPAPPAEQPKGPLEIGVRSAILVALENNPALKVERLNPLITRTSEDVERAAFDPVLGAEASASRQRGQTSRSWGLAAEAALAQRLPTGTSVELGASWTLADGTNYTDRSDTTRLGLSVTQALLQGAGVAVNLAGLRQARLDTLASHYELRGFAETLVSDVEKAYWDYALAQRQIEIYDGSLKLAEQQLSETKERITIGKLADTELAAAQAEVAQRREALIYARGELAKAHLRLLRLLNPQGAGLWSRGVVLQVQPTVPQTALEPVEDHVQLALKWRPDLNEAKLRILHGDLELVKTRNGLLPKLDLFMTLGKSGYAHSAGHSVGDLGGNAYDAMVGLSYEFPLGNRAAKAQHERATLTRQQLDEALANLTQLAQLDVRTAYIEVSRSREQVTATAATRSFREESLRAETEKFHVGKSTSLLVAQAQRDLVASQIAEVQAVVNLLKGLVDLFRVEGSLLERRGIAAPGREPLK